MKSKKIPIEIVDRLLCEKLKNDLNGWHASLVPVHKREVTENLGSRMGTIWSQELPGESKETEGHRKTL